jgi:predicted lipoprotein with Yx(FWY)xxD motif
LTLSTNEVIGSYITATNGMTLYTYKNDSYNTSTCTDACAVTWPPYTVPAPGALSAVGLDGDVETITRPDGTYQVTYQGMPLYFYNKDLTPGDINGNNIGGVWSVATEPEQSGS